MNKVIFFFTSMVILLSCGPQIYKASSLDQSKKKVKTIAIIPFVSTIDIKKLPKGVTAESIRESEEKTGYNVQSNVYSEFLKRMSKDEYTVKFQDVDKTNALLHKENIKYGDIALKDKAELCQLLGVDAVISGKILMSKPMSDGTAVAVAFIFGAWGTTNETKVTLTIHDKSGELQWKYDHLASGSLGSNPESLTKSLMKNASRKFPYKK